MTLDLAPARVRPSWPDLPPEVRAAVEAHREFVARAVLADEVAFADADQGSTGFEGEVGDGERVTVAVTRV